MAIKWTQPSKEEVYYSQQPYATKINGRLYPMYQIRKVGHRVWGTYYINNHEFYMPYINRNSHTGKYNPDSNMYRTLVAAKQAFPKQYG